MKAINTIYKKGFLAVFVAIIALALLCFLTGCSSDEEDTNSTPEDLKITDSGYFTYQDTDITSWAVLVENTNIKWAATAAEITIVGYDDNDNIVGTDINYVNFLEPSGSIAVCGTSAIAGATRYEFSIDNSESIWSEESDITQADWEKAVYVDQINATIEPITGTTTFAGNIINDTSYDMDYPDVNIVLNNEDGKIVGGIQANVSSLEANSQSPFSITSLGVVPDYDSLTTYVSGNVYMMTDTEE